MPKTKLERATAIDEQMIQLANQKKRLLQQHKADERKARTRRLIQRGAILESFIPEAETYTEDEIQTFLKETLATKFARDALQRIRPASANTTTLSKAETKPNSTESPSSPLNPRSFSSMKQNGTSQRKRRCRHGLRAVRHGA